MKRKKRRWISVRIEKGRANSINFQLFFSEESKAPSKSCPHTYYSKELNRLFIQKVEVPIHFKTSIALPENYEIRSYLISEDERYQNQIVEKDWHSKLLFIFSVNINAHCSLTSIPNSYFYWWLNTEFCTIYFKSIKGSIRYIEEYGKIIFYLWKQGNSL